MFAFETLIIMYIFELEIKSASNLFRPSNEVASLLVVFNKDRASLKLDLRG